MRGITMQLRQFILSAAVAALLLTGQQLYGFSVGEFGEIAGRSAARGLGYGAGGAYGWRLGSALWDGTTFLPRYMWRSGKKWKSERKMKKEAARKEKEAEEQAATAKKEQGEAVVVPKKVAKSKDIPAKEAAEVPPVAVTAAAA